MHSGIQVHYLLIPRHQDLPNLECPYDMDGMEEKSCFFSSQVKDCSDLPENSKPQCNQQSHLI